MAPHMVPWWRVSREAGKSSAIFFLDPAYLITRPWADISTCSRHPAIGGDSDTPSEIHHFWVNCGSSLAIPAERGCSSPEKRLLRLTILNDSRNRLSDVKGKRAVRGGCEALVHCAIETAQWNACPRLSLVRYSRVGGRYSAATPCYQALASPGRS